MWRLFRQDASSSVFHTKVILIVSASLQKALSCKVQVTGHSRIQLFNRCEQDQWSLRSYQGNEERTFIIRNETEGGFIKDWSDVAWTVGWTTRGWESWKGGQYDCCQVWERSHGYCQSQVRGWEITGCCHPCPDESTSCCWLARRC